MTENNSNNNPSTDKVDPHSADATGQPKTAVKDSAKEVDEFDLTGLRADQGFDDPLADTVQSEIDIGRPSKDIFIRTHPDAENYWPIVWCLELKDHPTHNGLYVVARSILDDVRNRYPANCIRKRIITVVDEYSVVSLWPQTVHDPADGKINSWVASALRVAVEAHDKWIRVESKKHAREYRAIPAHDDLGEPEFPEMTMQEIFDRAFEHYRIDALDHPALKALSGRRV